MWLLQLPRSVTGDSNSDRLMVIMDGMSGSRPDNIAMITVADQQSVQLAPDASNSSGILMMVDMVSVDLALDASDSAMM